VKPLEVYKNLLLVKKSFLAYKKREFPKSSKANWDNVLGYDFSNEHCNGEGQSRKSKSLLMMKTVVSRNVGFGSIKIIFVVLFFLT